MKTAKEVFTEIWTDHFGNDEELDKELQIILNDHDYIFMAIEEYGKQQYNQAIEDAAENVEMIRSYYPTTATTTNPSPQIKYAAIDKQSILKLKKL